MIGMRYLPYLILFLIFFSGCAPRKEVIIVKQVPVENAQEETKKQQEDTTAIPDTTSYFKFTPDTETAQSETPAVKFEENAGKENKIKGFRVQIFAFSSRKRAERAKEEAERVLSLPVYIEYDPTIDGPYKVRVGDFTTREEAEKYKEKLRQEGYPDAFVVETYINENN